MAPFGKREPRHAGSGIDQPEPESILRRWRAWIMGLLKPGSRASNGARAEPPPPKAKGRRSPLR
jgi:hypothetical protein